MRDSLPEEDHLGENHPEGELPALEQPQSPWSTWDLAVFGLFFGLTVLFLPVGIVYAMRVFKPGIPFTLAP